MADCYDEDGNKIPCDKIRGDFGKSDDLSKGSEMKKSRSLSPAQKKWLQDNPDYKGTRRPISEVGEKIEKIYRSPSKNKKQTETLEIIKRGGFIDIGSTPSIRTVEISEDASGIDDGLGRKIEKKTKTSKTSKNYKPQKRSIYSSKGPRVNNKRGLYTCTKKGCVGKGERSIKKQMKRRK